MPLAVVRPDTLYAWSGTSLLVVNTRGECGEDRLAAVALGALAMVNRMSPFE